MMKKTGVLNPRVFVVVLGIILITSHFISGCCVTKNYDPYDNSMQKPKIGLLADSQIQTLKSMKEVDWYKKKSLDRIVNVSLRPPALDYLSQSLLEYFLSKLINVDVILYLGDAANNGCDDELNIVFDTLKKYREKNNTPIFFVIGNHDYLGAGNTSRLKYRKSLCDDREDSDANKYLNKLDLIRKAHEFNIDNMNLMVYKLVDGKNKLVEFSQKWDFKDNYNEAEINENCMPAPECNGEEKNRCSEIQHHRDGCYLAGTLVYKENGTEILLVDTSDYFDLKMNPELGKAGFYGIRGAISEKGKDSQIKWFEKNDKRAEQISKRIIASHYPVDGLNPPGIKRVGQSIRLLDLEPKPTMGNYWFSAHTHAECPKTFYRSAGALGDKEHIIKNLNIGSTTDKIPHAAVASIDEDNDIDARIIQVEAEEGFCEAILLQLSNEPTPDSPEYKPVASQKQGDSIFGIDKNYRNWKKKDRRNAINNLKKFLEYKLKSSSNKADDALKIKTCIAVKAAEKEQKKANR
jgi:hypothetical protein